MSHQQKDVGLNTKDINHEMESERSHINHEIGSLPPSIIDSPHLVKLAAYGRYSVESLQSHAESAPENLGISASGNYQARLQHRDAQLVRLRRAFVDARLHRRRSDASHASRHSSQMSVNSADIVGRSRSTELTQVELTEVVTSPTAPAGSNSQPKPSGSRDSLNSRAEAALTAAAQRRELEAQTIANRGFLKRCFFFLVSLWAEILSLACLVASFFIDTRVGIAYLVFEVLFDVTIVGAIVARWKTTKTITKKNNNLRWSIILYLFNRLFGVLQPTVGLVFAAHELAQENRDITATRKKTLIISCTICAFDLAVTLATFSRIARWFMPVQWRRMTIDDVPALRKIEEACFPDEDLGQQASANMIARRIVSEDSHPGLSEKQKCGMRASVLVEHAELGVIGSLYVRPVSRKWVASEPHHPSWEEVNKEGDFSVRSGQGQTGGADDALYIIGIQSLPQTGLRVANFLDSALLCNCLELGYGKWPVLGGPRIPQFHTVAMKEEDLKDDSQESQEGLNKSLQTYVHSGQDKLLSHLVRSGNNLFYKTEVLCGLPNYWRDPDSRDCAALVEARMRGWVACMAGWLPGFVRSVLARAIWILFVAGDGQ